jgi:hypothetical protein
MIDIKHCNTPSYTNDQILQYLNNTHNIEDISYLVLKYTYNNKKSQ